MTFFICNFIKKTQKLDNLSIDLTVSNKLQCNLEISSNFVAFLENLNQICTMISGACRFTHGEPQESQGIFYYSIHIGIFLMKIKKPFHFVTPSIENKHVCSILFQKKVKIDFLQRRISNQRMRKNFERKEFYCQTCEQNQNLYYKELRFLDAGRLYKVELLQQKL